MLTGQTPFFAKVSYGLSVALLALSFTSGVSTVRAEGEDPAQSWREMLINPIIDAMQAVEARMGNLEATVAQFAGSFASRQITTDELCVADATGAKTCITKAQLDKLLGAATHAAAAEPVAVEPAITEAKSEAKSEAKTDEPKAEEPKVELTSEEPKAEEPKAVAMEPAKELAPMLTEAKTAEPAISEPAELETIATVAPAPAMPEQAQATLATDDEPAHTGSVTMPAPGAAIVTAPEVEVTIPAPLPTDE